MIYLKNIPVKGKKVASQKEKRSVISYLSKPKPIDQTFEDLFENDYMKVGVSLMIWLVVHYP